MNPVDLTIVLLDLVRFTSLTNIHGDLAGADAAADLVAVTTDAIGPGVELVKTLGDGVLLRADEPGLGLMAASQIVQGVHELGRGLDLKGRADHGPAGRARAVHDGRTPVSEPTEPCRGDPDLGQASA